MEAKPGEIIIGESAIPIRDRIIGFLADHPGADHEEIAAGAGTRPNSTSRTLTSLHRQGLVEPLPKDRPQDRSRWQLVPEDRREEVASRKAKEDQQRQSTSGPGANLTPAQKAWFVKQFVRDDTVNKILLDDAADQTKAAARARREARAWNQMVARNKKDFAQAKAAGSPLAAFYGAKQLVINALEGVRGLARNTYVEIEDREHGAGQIADYGWVQVRYLLRQHHTFGRGIDQLITDQILRDGGGSESAPETTEGDWVPEMRELGAGPSLAEMADVELDPEICDAEILDDDA